MGRSNLQGTPWHYEYLSPNPRKNKTPSYCEFLSNYQICQHKQSLLYGDKCTAYMKHHCKFRVKKTKTTTKSNDSKQHSKNKKTSIPKRPSNSTIPNRSLERIIRIRKKHSKYFKSKIKPTLRCPKCNSVFWHRYQMEYKHGYAIHYLTCHVCKHEWEHIIDDSLLMD